MKGDDRASQNYLFWQQQSFLDICVHPCLAVPRLEAFRVEYMSKGGFGFCIGILG